MADEVGQVRMQVQLEKEALERARTQRAADRYLLILLLGSQFCDTCRLVCLRASAPGPACYPLTCSQSQPLFGFLKVIPEQQTIEPSSRHRCTRNSHFGLISLLGNAVLIAHCMRQAVCFSCVNTNGVAGRPGLSRSPTNKSSLHRRLWRAKNLWKQLALLS